MRTRGSLFAFIRHFDSLLFLHDVPLFSPFCHVLFISEQ